MPVRNPVPACRTIGILLTLLIMSGALPVSAVPVASQSTESTRDIQLPAQSTENEPGFIWIGHRGSSGPFVSNTMSAFREGIARGYQALETDLKITSDGHFILFHNSHLNTGSGEVVESEPLNGSTPESKTLEEIRAMTVSQTRTASNGPEGTFTGQIATLEEFLQLCKEQDVKAVLDLKWTTGVNNNDQSNVGKLIAQVEEIGWLENTIFLTSMRPVLDAIRSHSGDIHLQWLVWTQSAFNQHRDWALENDISLGIGYDEVTQSLVDLMHENGRVVNAFTVNNAAAARTLIGYGVDMVTTDYLYTGEDGEVVRKDYSEVEPFGGFFISPKELVVETGQVFNFETRIVEWGDTTVIPENEIDWEIIGLDAVYGRGGIHAEGVSEGQVVAHYQETYSDTANVSIREDVSAGFETGVPERIRLSQNYPNPFNPATHIRYDLSAQVHACLTVYDALGRPVATLVDEKQQPGSYTVVFDATSLASGTYIYELAAGGAIQRAKMTLIK
ncbi:MAG: glycerophosphodiester phosphodiesterase family protein [Bacteroidota bacterium]